MILVNDKKILWMYNLMIAYLHTMRKTYSLFSILAFLCFDRKKLKWTKDFFTLQPTRTKARYTENDVVVGHLATFFRVKYWRSITTEKYRFFSDEVPVRAFRVPHCVFFLLFFCHIKMIYNENKITKQKKRIRDYIHTYIYRSQGVKLGVATMFY